MSQSLDRFSVPSPFERDVESQIERAEELGDWRFEQSVDRECDERMKEKGEE